jgi:hypothetical protein
LPAAKKSRDILPVQYFILLRYLYFLQCTAAVTFPNFIDYRCQVINGLQRIPFSVIWALPATTLQQGKPAVAVFLRQPGASVRQESGGMSRRQGVFC